MCMDIQARLLDPVCVRIGRNFNVVVSSDDEKNDCSRRALWFCFDRR